MFIVFIELCVFEMKKRIHRGKEARVIEGDRMNLIRATVAIETIQGIPPTLTMHFMLSHYTIRCALNG